MWTILALIGIPMVALALVMLVAVWEMNRVAERLVGRRHRTLEEILDTDEVPAVWRRPYERRLAVLRRRQASPERLRQMQGQAKTKYLHDLDDLMHYVGTSPLVEDEEARDTILERLAAIQETWQERDAGDF